MSYWTSSKALNPDNLNEFGEVIASSGDSLPVGTEVDYDGSASNIPIGWEEINGINLVGYTLYENTTGSVNPTLNDNTTNYSYIDIFYKDINNQHNFVRVSNPNGKSIVTTGYYTNGVDDLYLRFNIKYISGNTVTNGICVECNVAENSSVLVNSNNSNIIYKIVGYKEV